MRRNDPYAGGYITRHYGRPREGVHALQIEIARELYMDEGRIERLPGLRGGARRHDAVRRGPCPRGRTVGGTLNRVRRPGPRAQKNGGACGTAKFREETSKKADSAVRDRIAAMHNLGGRSFVCK